MNFEEKLLEAVQKMYPDAEVEIVDVNKTNVTRRAMVIRENGTNISPSIYLEELERRYNDGMDFNVIISKIDTIYQENKDAAGIVPEMSRENFLSHTTLKLINKRMNPDKYESCPSLEWGDDLIAVPIYFDTKDDDRMSALESKALLNYLGITADEALEAGLQSIQPTVKKMRDVLIANMAGSDGVVPEELEDVLDAADAAELYVMTVPSGLYGAVSVMAPGQLERISELLDDDVYIIPSSIHEVLLLKADGRGPEELNSMVKDVNSSTVKEDEILSDHVYLYDRNLKKVQNCAEQALEV